MTLDLAATPEEVGLSSSQLARVAPHFNQYLKDGRLAGWLATVSRRGQLCFLASGGYRDREAGLPVDDDTIWRIYSMTKPITSVAVMMAYEEGLFDLDDEIAKWLPSFAEPRVYVSGPPAAPVTVPATEPVRVHHLLSHMSGLTYGFQYTHPVDAIYRARGYEFGSPPGKNLTDVVDEWASMPLLFQPGSRWNYSVGVDVLGRLIECWSGQSFPEFLSERLLTPLGMTETTWSCPPEQADRLAMLYVPGRDGCVPFPKLAGVATKEPRFHGGGGGLLSTAGDYQKFTDFLVAGGTIGTTRLISSRTLALMASNHLPDGGDLAHWATDSFSEQSYDGVGFGLGFSVVVDQARNKSLTSPGTFAWGGAASTVFWVDPKEELTVAFFTQLLPSSTYNIRRELAQLVYGSLTD